ncbi:MAG: type IV secretion system protein, partial [Microlunatus sp.]|nr:type IV secretion system protein [Microlunatus sp.]
MALLTATTPKPSLALVVNDARAVKRAEKSAARPLRRWARRLTVGLAMTFALLGFSGGTAQAWPWDVAENITAFITNFCGPQDVPPLANYTGTDTTFGLNSVENSTVRNTIVADPGSLSSVAGKEGNGLERLQTAFGSDKTLTSPTYERYGFTSLAWTNFGSGCFSIGYWFSPISNLAFTLAVKFPMIVGMALLHLAMDNWLYDVFTTIISPFVKVFTTIFTPWVYFIAPIGVLWVWIKSRGSVQQVMKAAVWVLCIFGVFLWMGNNTSTLVTKANNFVTVFAGAAAEKISTAATGTATPADNPLGAIDQALWHGVPYQAWLVGEVGDAEAGADIEREKAGQLGWGPAILNGLYVGTDEKARDVEANRQDWNGRSYSPDASDDSKTGSWTGNGGEKSWQGIPLLTVVKFMCNDSADGGENSGDEADNRWFYGGQCDAAGAGTTQMVGHFTGATYNEQLVSAFAGGYATLAVVLAIGLCSIYLALQKMLFYFLLLFGPIFLAVSLFADDKRRAFAKRYFELLLANIIKQCVAVCVVLFVAFSISNLLYPPPSVGLPEIPWMLKPSVAMLFFIALVLFLIPLRNILTAAAKGDTKVVDQTANAPVVAAKGAAKVAVVATAAVATGGAALAFSGTSLGAAAMAGGKVGKAGQLLTTASRVVGSRGGVGKALRVMGQGANLGQQVGTSQLDKQGRADAVLQGAKGLISDNPGKYQTDSNGKVTKEGLAAAKKDFTKDAQIGTAAVRSAAAFNATQAAANEGFLKRTGSYSPSDPRNPDNIKLAAIAKEGDRLDTLEQVKNA